MTVIPTGFRRSRRRCLCALLLFAGLAQAQTQRRVDDDDPDIVYTPEASWFRNADPNPMDAGEHHMVTTDTAASATFRFTGTGIHYMAPLWADTISTQVRLDGGVPEVLSLQDTRVPPETDGATTVESSVLWSVTGLENIEHVLVIDVPPGGSYAVVDMLIVDEEDDPNDPTTDDPDTEVRPTSTSTETTTTRTRLASDEEATSPKASPTPATRTGLSIAIGIVCSVAGLLLLALLAYFLRRRRQRRKEREIWAQNYEAAAQQQQPMMDEVDDSINAPPKRRYRSVPSRNSMRGSGYLEEGLPPAGGGAGAGAGVGSVFGAAAGSSHGVTSDNMSLQSNMTTPSASAKQTSKLRQVVATTDDSTSQSQERSGLVDLSVSSSSAAAAAAAASSGNKKFSVGGGGSGSGEGSSNSSRGNGSGNGNHGFSNSMYPRTR